MFCSDCNMQGHSEFNCKRKPLVAAAIQNNVEEHPQSQFPAQKENLIDSVIQEEGPSTAIVKKFVTYNTPYMNSRTVDTMIHPSQII